MGESALRRVQAGFSWSDYGHKMIAAYQKILSLRAGNHSVAARRYRRQVTRQ